MPVLTVVVCNSGGNDDVIVVAVPASRVVPCPRLVLCHSGGNEDLSEALLVVAVHNHRVVVCHSGGNDDVSSSPCTTTCSMQRYKRMVWRW